jgi:hypothetical protein
MDHASAPAHESNSPNNRQLGHELVQTGRPWVVPEDPTRTVHLWDRVPPQNPIG